jgi:hypothetical protein
MKTAGLCAVLALSAGSILADEPSAAERALRGKWTLDKTLFAEGLPGYAEASPEERRALKERFAKDMPDISMEFGVDEVSFGFPPKPPETSRYRVTGRDGKKLHLEITSKDDRGRPSVDQTVAELVSRNVLRVTGSGAPFTLVLRRVE